MPTGIQQRFTEILCAICQTRIHESGVCGHCRTTHQSECASCEYVAYDTLHMNREMIERLVGRNQDTCNFVIAHDSGDTVCDMCVHYCSDCGEAFQWESERDVCCMTRHSAVNYYSYRPSFLYYSMQDNVSLITARPNGTNLYMGVELEVARMSGPPLDCMINFMSPEDNDFVYFKEDASIGSDGVEIVTHPATLEAFERYFPFDALDAARKRGARSFAYGSCGFHIHVSRTAFSATHLWRFSKFQLMNPRLCQMVAQRDESQYASWYLDSEEVRSLPDYVKGKKSNGRRYLAINFQNTHTVELRYFKGNLLKGAILKNLEFVQSVYDYTKSMTVSQVMLGALTESKYMAWLDEQEKYPNLKYFITNNQSQESY